MSLTERDLELIAGAIRDMPESVMSGGCSPDCARQYLAFHFAERLRPAASQLDPARFIATCRGCRLEGRH
jgi:hypothetical protein